jgi:hypothetical protein
VNQSTFADNTGAQNSGIEPAFSTLTVGGSLFVRTSCLLPPLAAIVDAGYNVTDDSSCGFGSTSVVSTDARIGLQPLAANGSVGPKTRAIPAISSARSVVPVSACLATDERGVPRPGLPGARFCSAGAYEFSVPLAILKIILALRLGA